MNWTGFICCIGAGVWMFVAMLAWALCRAAGLADEEMGLK